MRTLFFIVVCFFSGWVSAQETTRAEYDSTSWFLWFENDYPSIRTEIIRSLTGAGINSDIKVSRAFKTEDEKLRRIWSVSGISPDKIKNIKEKLMGISGVIFCEPEPRYRLFYTPNDLLSAQWHLPQIKAEQAWNLCKGGKKIVVALVDDGMDTAHSDLKKTLWHNAKEIPNNGKDDDKNGYIDDWFGWDVADNDNNPCVVVADGLNHGTHCAGIMGAMTDNSNGIASIGFDIQIMPLKSGQAGVGWLTNPYQGVDYAIQNGARVISMSWGGGAYSATYQALFDAAAKKGIVCVAAAGNSSTSSIHYPSGYNNVIAVGSTTTGDKMSSFSNFGTWVDLVAPGSNIYSTLSGNTYGNMSGTSMATPLVSGLCALMLSKNPSFTATQIEACLKANCDNIDAVNPTYKGLMGAGRINAYKSLLCVKSVMAAFTSSKRSVCTGDTVQFYDKSTGSPSIWKWTFTGGTPSSSSAKNPVITYSTAGNYKVELIVSDGTNSDTFVFNNYIFAGKPKVKFSGNQTIGAGSFGTIKADFTGNGPWDLVYTDGKKNYTLNNITSNPNFILVLPDSTRTWKPVSVKQSGCSGSVSDSAKITVLQRVGSKCDSAYRFQMNLGGSGDERGYKVLVWDDTSVLVVGQTSSYGAGNLDGFAARISLQGRTIWFKTYGGSSDDYIYSAAFDDNKNIYLAGQTYSGTTQKGVWLFKVNSAGTLLWKKHYDGSNLETIYHVYVSRNKKYVYAMGPSISNSFGSEDYTFYKFDTAGNVSWVKQIGDADFNRNYDTWEDSSGNLYCAGYQGVPFPYSTSAVCKLTSSGTVAWSKKMAFNTSGYNNSLQKIMGWKEKAIFVYGPCGLFNGSTYSSRECHLMRLDLSGNVLWDKKYNIGTMNPTQSAIIGDEIYLYGEVGTSNLDAYLMKLDTNGNVLKSVTIGTSSTNESIQDVIPSLDGGIFYTGYTTAGGTYQMWLAKTNCSMSSLCNITSVTPSVTSMSITSGTVSYSSQGFNSITTGITTNTYAPKPAFICKTNINISNPPDCNLKADMKIDPSCTGGPVQFTDISTDLNGYNITGWWWNFGDGIRAVNASSVTHYYQNNGTYNVQLIVKSEKGLNACTDTINVKYVSLDTFRLKNKLPDATICFGDSVKFNAPELLCGSLPYRYRWSPAYGVSDTQSAQPYFSPKKTTKYYIKITDFNGVVLRDSFTVNVNRTCCVSKARFTLNPPQVCDGDSAHFVNTSTHKKNAVFNWKFTNGSIASYTGKTPPPVFYSAVGTYTVRLIMKDSCTEDTFFGAFDVLENPYANAGNDTNICMPDTIKIGTQALDWHQYTWYPSAGLNNYRIAEPTAIITKPITYKLKVINEAGCISWDSIKITRFIVPNNLGRDTTICSGKSMVLRSVSKATKYLWNTGSTADTLKVSNPGLYWLDLTLGDCHFRDTILISGDSTPVFSLGPDTAICRGASPYILGARNLKVKSVSYQWDNNSVAKNRTVNYSGTYWLQLKHNTCIFRDSVKISIDSIPYFTLGNDTTVCDNVLPLQLSSKGFHNGKEIYQWDDNSAFKYRSVSLAGTYWCREQRGACFYSDTIKVQTDSMPVFSLGKDTQMCENGFPVTLKPVYERLKNANNFWSNSSTKTSLIVSQSGTYWLRKTNGTCSYADSIKLTSDKLSNMSLGNDTSLCNTGPGIIIAATGTFNANTKYLWDNGTSGSNRLVQQSGLYWLKVTNGKCTERDSILVQFDSVPSFTLGPDTTFCGGKWPYLLQPLNLKYKNVNYKWENGNAGAFRFVYAPGTYSLTVSNACVASASITIDTIPKPWVNLGTDTAICEGDTLQLKAPLLPYTRYLWNTGNTTHYFTVFTPGKYSVNLSNKCGTASDEITVKTKDCSCPVYIPNSFSPGRSRGINDDYHVVFSCPYEYFEIMIFNRWGEMVFQSTDTAFKWDGMYKGEWIPNGAYQVVVKLRHRYENMGKEFYRSGYLYVTE